MFRINKIIMAQFGYFEGVTVLLDAETTVLTGGNGTGKSTSYDAVRLALGSHKYANEKRRLDDYLKDNAIAVVGIIVTNKRTDGKPGVFRKLGYKDAVVTIARVYIPKSQGRESRFVLADGELAPERILDATEGKDWLTEGRFLERLQTIGINGRILDQLIIRQSKVTEIINKSNRELYDTVLSHAGATEVVQGYYAVRKDNDKAAKTLEEREKEYQLGEKELDRLEKEVKRLKDYEDLEAEIVGLAMKAEAAKAHQLLLRKRNAEAKLKEIDLDELRERLKKERAEEKEKKGAAETLDEEIKTWDQGTKKLSDDLAKLDQERSQLLEQRAPVINARAELKRLAKLAVTSDLQERARAAQEAWAELKGKRDSAEKIRVEAQNRADSLAQGKTAWPAAVAKTLTALASQKIPHECLAHWVDPLPVDKPLVEAALGARRYAISVPSARLKETLKVAQINGFPGPIFAEGEQTNGEDSLLRPGRPIPGWLQGFSIHDGVLKTPEGQWVTPTSDLVLGPKPQEAEIRAADAEAKKMAKLVADFDQQLAKRQELLDAATSEHLLGVRRDEFANIIAKGIGLDDKDELLEDARRKLEIKIHERKGGKGPAREKLKAAKDEHEAAYKKASKTAVLIHEKEEEQAKWAKLLEETAPSLEAALLLISAELRARVEDPDEVFEDESRLRNRAQERRGDLAKLAKPDTAVRKHHARYHENVQKQKGMVEEAKAKLNDHRESLEKARKQYAIFAGNHLTIYEKRLRAVAHQFGVSVQVHFTPISSSSTDVEIDSAQLEVRFGYKKTPTLVNGGGFSGGEDVINALMLQLALQDFDDDGFIMIDQPYDHLDAVNTRTVAEYLARSKLQVIIALPSDTKPDMFRGMVRGILFHKAPEGKPWAHPPEIIGVRTP